MGENPVVFEQFLRRLRRRRILRFIFGFFKRLLFFIILLLFIVWTALQFEAVQNALANWVTTNLSEKLNTEVSIKRVNIEFFNKLVLEEFYMEDQQGDTILYSKELKAEFNTNLIKLLNRELEVDHLYLTTARINILRDSAEQYNRLKFLQEFFKNDKPKSGTKKKKSNPFEFDVNGVHLSDVQFNQDDNVKGQLLSFYIGNGEILLDHLDLANNFIGVKSVILEKPVVRVIEKLKFPVSRPPETLPVAVEIKPAIEDSIRLDSSEMPEPFLAKVGYFAMIDGKFEYDQMRRSPVRTRPDDELDYNHLSVFDINIDIDSFQYLEDVYTGQVNNISFEEKSGFVLNQLSAKDATVSDELLRLNNMKLITPNSNIGDTLVMQYRSFSDFKDFNNKVRMVGKFKNAEIAIRDIMVFAPKLKRNRFFKQNKDEIVKIDGLVRGSVNKLRGRNLYLQINGNTILQGNFSTRDLSVRGEEFLALKLDRFRSNFSTLRLLVPEFNAPPNFDKLGVFDFSGRFDGFFNDFVAFGKLSTDLGRAELDMHMNLKQGRALAEYKGKLSLIDFDLGSWSGNNDFGEISFVSEVKEGLGLTLETVNATLAGKIEEFAFKGYTYDNVTLDGKLTKNLFDGELVSKDKNFDFIFNGAIDFEDSIPSFDFDASINRFDLLALNFSKQPLVLSGDVELDFINFKISDIEGKGSFYDFQVINEIDTFFVDTLVTELTKKPDQTKSLTIDSDVLNLKMDGLFDVQEVPSLFGQYLVRNFPEFSEKFNIKAKDKELKDSHFDFKLVIPNSKNLLDLIDPKLDTIRYAYVEGRMDNMLDSVKLRAEVPVFQYGNIKFDDILLSYEGIRDKSKILLDIYHTTINNKQHFEPLLLDGRLERDSFHFEINSTNFTSVFDDLNLRGKLFLYEEDYFQVQFLPSNLIILKDQWNILEDNYIRFGKGFVETQNFDLQNFEKRIVLESVEDTGLTVALENFDLSIIDDWWDYDKLDFGGRFVVLLEAGDIYKLENIYATAISDSMHINGDYFGELRLDAAMRSLKDDIQAYINIDRGDRRLNGEGIITAIKKQRRSQQNKDFDFDFTLEKYPLDILEYFIPNGISNTVGTMDSKVRLYGKAKRPKILGEAFVRDLGVTIDYLQTRYTAPAGNLKINDQFLFDASDNVIYDSLGNTATITGGIRHTNLKDLRLDVNMKSEQFLFLDTDKADNDLYYGYGIGKGDVTFTGSFQKTDIDVNAVTGKGSKLNIPINYEQDASEVSFIKFVKRDSVAEEEPKGRKDLRGVEIDMNLEVTPEAEVWLIFDERAGDIVKGRGRGNIQMQVRRNGDINMYGDYEIEKGEYLFTLLNVVNKPFIVKQGGMISWSGDPFGATLDLEAEYAGLTTSPYNFIEEYLNNDNIKSEARSPTKVELKMLLKGPMLQPEINFDIDFPNLNGGELQNYTDNKLRLISQDQNELNRQVFGLMVLGGFLPNQNSGVQGQGLIGGLNNTVSELLTNQLSIYLTEILSDIFVDVDFISGVDFKVNYNIYQAEEDVLNPNVQIYGTEIELGTRFDLFNDRFTVDIGGSYVDQGGQYFTGDIILEYFITKNRRLKLRMYRVSDQTIQGRRDKFGAGISVRREFDSFSEFLEGMRRSAKNLKENG